MRLRHVFLTLAGAWMLSGCKVALCNKAVEDQVARAAVADLVSQCETMLAENARVRAEVVIKLGRPTLHALCDAWKGNDDPDVAVWTQACINCILRSISLEQYIDLLKSRMKEDPLYAGHACILSEDEEALSFLSGEFIRHAETLNFNADSISWKTHGFKQTGEPSAIKALRSKDKDIRSKALATLRCFNSNTFQGEEPYPIADYPWEADPSLCEDRIQKLWALWEKKRPSREVRFREALPDLRKQFKSRDLDLPPGDLDVRAVCRQSGK